MIPTFDFDRIVEEMEMEPEDILHLMTIYQDEFQKDLNELERNLSECNWLLIKNKLHKMKGDAANLCLKPLAETFAAMENSSENKDSQFLCIQLDTVKTIRTQFHSAFQNYSEKAR